MSEADLTPDDQFGAANLPYASAIWPDGTRHVVVRIGSSVISLTSDAPAEFAELFAAGTLDALLAAGRPTWTRVRAMLPALLDSAGRVPLAGLPLTLPFTVADYVDFYASEHHASNVGRLFRPDDEPLKPNWKHLPVGYHGRAGTVVVSGTDIVRPCGQRKLPGDEVPAFGPSVRLDIEAELGFVIGTGSVLGSRIPVEDFASHVFGAFLVNDWSARDIQAWEYVPLGPHLGKSFATSISPWVVPIAALLAARVPLPGQDDPQPLPYLREPSSWGLDVDLAVSWNGEEVSRPPYRTMYWSPAQMLAHLTVNGASTRTGDMFASGTISGPSRFERGAFLELTWSGAEPVMVKGEQRTFLVDGDEVVITATAPGASGGRIGFGEVSGKILPARC